MRTRLTERDLNRLVKRVINEQQSIKQCSEEEVTKFMEFLTSSNNSPASIKNGVEGQNVTTQKEYLTLEGFGMKCGVSKQKFAEGGI